MKNSYSKTGYNEWGYFKYHRLNEYINVGYATTASLQFIRTLTGNQFGERLQLKIYNRYEYI